MMRRNLERKLCQGALEFALDQFQTAHLNSSIDAKLAAAELLYTAAKQAWVALEQVDSSIQPSDRMPLGIA